MTLKQAQQIQLEQKVYIVSFPKSGTHLMERWVQQLAGRIKDREWLGNVSGNAWKAELSKTADLLPEAMDAFPAGGYLKGHVAHSYEMARALWDHKISTVFVYRNLRAVAVSIAHHVTDDSERLKHFDKSIFAGMTPTDALPHVIRGRGDHAPLADRWCLFAPWLEEQWTLRVRFEDMVNEPYQTASNVLRYVAGFTAQRAGMKIELSRDAHDHVVDCMVKAGQRHDTTTFRKGTADGWRDEWTDEAERAFVETGCDQLNREAGY